MGLFDTFIVPKYRCPHCGHKYDAHFQTKDFGDGLIGGFMETVTLGQDLRKPIKRSFLLYSTSGFLTQKISEAKAERLAKDKKHYELRKHCSEYTVHKISSSPIIFACKNKVFTMYDSCPKCDKWIEVRGLIKNWKFRGGIDERSKPSRLRSKKGN